MRCGAVLSGGVREETRGNNPNPGCVHFTPAATLSLSRRRRVFEPVSGATILVFLLLLSCSPCTRKPTKGSEGGAGEKQAKDVARRNEKKGGDEGEEEGGQGGRAGRHWQPEGLAHRAAT